MNTFRAGFWWKDPLSVFLSEKMLSLYFSSPTNMYIFDLYERKCVTNLYGKYVYASSLSMSVPFCVWLCTYVQLLMCFFHWSVSGSKREDKVTAIKALNLCNQHNLYSYPLVPNSSWVTFALEPSLFPPPPPREDIGHLFIFYFLTFQSKPEKIVSPEGHRKIWKQIAWAFQRFFAL
jgi:hypothetical protein